MTPRKAEMSHMSWAVSFPLIKQRKIYFPGGLEAKAEFVKHFGMKDTKKNHRKSFINYNPQLLVRETQSNLQTVSSPPAHQDSQRKWRIKSTH